MHILNPNKNLEELLKPKKGKTLTILDYDGTIAPFKVNRYEAYPDPELLDIILKLTELFPQYITTIISGRSAKEVQQLIGKVNNIVIWGNHGWEKIDANGSYKRFKISNTTMKALKLAISEAEKYGMSKNCEIKIASIALHTENGFIQTGEKSQGKVLSHL